MDWKQLAASVSQVVTALAPIAEIAAPEAASAIALGEKIIQAAVAAEPTAVALVQQITSGTPPTAEQLKQFSDDYEASYQKLKADIASKLV